MSARHLPADPRHHQIGKTIEFLIAQCASSGNSVPFLYAAAAAGRGRMLGGEYRMPAPWRLPPVLCRMRRTHPFAQHIVCVPGKRFRTFGLGVIGIMGIKSEFRTECGTGQPFQSLVDPIGIVPLVYRHVPCLEIQRIRMVEPVSASS
jgi:hypothetical protein